MLVQIESDFETASTGSVETRLAIVECQVPVEGATEAVILAADFFDGETIVVVYRGNTNQSEHQGSWISGSMLTIFSSVPVRFFIFNAGIPQCSI